MHTGYWRVLACGALLAATTLLQASHDETLGLRFVSADGVNISNCLDHHAPCASLAYALARADPGHSIRVAEGRYDLGGVDPETFLWGTTKARGGYSEDDDWLESDPVAHPSLVTGIDSRYAEVLAARGFTLIAADGSLLHAAQSLQAVQNAPMACVNGFAGANPCSNVDLYAQIALSQFTSRPMAAANVWGFVDRNDNREYAVLGLSNATAVIDVSDPANPRQVGSVPGNVSSWREVKVFQRFDAAANRWRAYVYVSTEAPNSGLQIIDMSGLPGSVALVNTLTDVLTQHTLYVSNIDYATNVALPGAAPFLYVAGSNLGDGGWRAYSLANPVAPAFVGAAPAAAGYMHDSAGLLITDSRAAQCAAGHNPCEVLVDFNVEAVALWDVTDKTAPVRLSTTPFASFRYVHSGWPSVDQRFLIAHDELDEIRGAVPRTNIYVLDLADLRAPTLGVNWVGPDNSTDHNGYSKGNRYYVSHYRRGLVVYDSTDPRLMREIGNFDTFVMTVPNVAGTDGAWGVYPYLPSGTILVSDIDNGLFLLKDNTTTLPNGVGSLRMGAATLQLSESAGSASVRVQRVGGSSGAVSVSYATQDGSAIAGSDYSAANGTLNWSNGDVADKLLTIAVTNDSVVEGDETFNVVLSVVGGGAALAATTTTVTITNDDAAPVMPPPASGGGGAFGWLALLALLAVLAGRTGAGYLRHTAA